MTIARRTNFDCKIARALVLQDAVKESVAERSVIVNLSMTDAFTGTAQQSGAAEVRTGHGGHRPARSPDRPALVERPAMDRFARPRRRTANRSSDGELVTEPT
ncbi:hypothetical protein UQW22_09495 [Isoptericola halotolerans]|uniref:hypothetical protein n=1 Tax=Isoptericola halotolerans TaxID=300560 RepID=UPI00388D966C